VLDGRHDETIGHESSQTLKVEGWWQALAVWDEVLFRPWYFTVQLVNLNREAVDIGVRATRLACCVLSYCCEGLGDCVCDTTEYLFPPSVPVS